MNHWLFNLVCAKMVVECRRLLLFAFVFDVPRDKYTGDILSYCRYTKCALSMISVDFKDMEKMHVVLKLTIVIDKSPKNIYYSYKSVCSSWSISRLSIWTHMNFVKCLILCLWVVNIKPKHMIGVIFCYALLYMSKEWCAKCRLCLCYTLNNINKSNYLKIKMYQQIEVLETIPILQIYIQIFTLNKTYLGW